MANDVRQMLYSCEFWIGHTKKPKKKTAFKHTESYFLKWALFSRYNHAILSYTSW